MGAQIIMRRVCIVVLVLPFAVGCLVEALYVGLAVALRSAWRRIVDGVRRAWRMAADL